MSNLRQSTIPFDHLLAELAAFPLASADALELGCIELDPTLVGSCGELWRRAERRLAAAFPNTSLDEMFGVRDRLWFDKPSKFPRPLYDYLWLLAYHTLEARGSTAAPRPLVRPRLEEGAGGADRRVLGREFWRWLSFALPPDLLLAALSCSDSFPSSITMLPPRLDRILKDEGFAETHQHFGAGLDFSQLWVAAVRRAADNDFKLNTLASPGAEMDDGRHFAAWLMRAALLRLMLAAFLKSDRRFLAEEGASRRDTEDALGVAEAGRTVDPGAHPQASLAAEPRWEFGAFLTVAFRRVERLAGATSTGVLRHAIWETLRGKLQSGQREHAELRSLYRRWGAREVPWVDQVENAQWGDPMARFFPPRGDGRITCEMQFITAALHHMSTVGRDDSLFARVFWQVQRVRNLVYRHVVQRPMTPGLLWFVRTYDRISPLRKGFGPTARTMALSLRASAVLSGHGHGLRSLEARTAPSDVPAELLDLVRHGVRMRHELADGGAGCREDVHAHPPSASPRSNGSCEFGLVLHLIRSRGGNLRQGRLVAHAQQGHADPATVRRVGVGKTPVASPDMGAGYRFARLYKTLRREVHCLGSLLIEFPRAVEVVRGIDVCTDELGVPVWVIAPFFRYVREAGDLASAFLNDAGQREVPPLRTTAHAGEDFIHLMGGLRRVDESVQYLRLRSGDRIGHGLALGVDAREWAQQHGPVAVYKEERLLDLVWEWGLYAHRGLVPPLGRALLLDHEIARLSKEIFLQEMTPFQVHLLVMDLHDERWLRAAGFPDRARWESESEDNRRAPGPVESRTTSAAESRQRLTAYLTDPELFDRGQSIEWVDPRADADALVLLQRHLRERLGATGITVEVNPSSNLLVGNLGDLQRHPFWRLDPPPGLGVEAAEPPVAICVGSDDPLTFATSLPEEYARLYDALILAGRKDEEVMVWLDRVRRAGLESRFTLPFSLDPRERRAVREQPVDRGRCVAESLLTRTRGVRLHNRIRPLP